MSLNVSLLSLDFQPRQAPPGVHMRVVRHSWTAVGGPDTAELLSEGAEEALAELAGWLRCPLMISRTEGLPVWWGYLEGVWLRKGQVEMGASLDGMANRVRVSYIPLPGGPRRYTDWFEDARSQRLFGVKELQALAGAEGCSPESADGLAAALLAEHANPPGELRRVRSPDAITLKARRACEGRLVARGWWHSLGWRAYQQPAGLEQNTAAASGSQGFGTPEAPMLRQRFVASVGVETWLVDRVGLHLRKVGNPDDSVVVELRRASGELLSIGQIAACDLIPGQGWVELLLNGGPAAIVPGAGYELRLRRSGGLDALNAYRVDHDLSANREDGSFDWWDGSNWVDVQPPASLLFKLAGTEDSLAQVRRMLLAGAGGQFLSGVKAPVGGVCAGLWRDGQSSAREEVERLLALGTSEGRRLLARVDEYRRAVIGQAPLPGEQDYYLMSDGGVLDAFRRRLLPGECPVGVWAHGADIAVLAPGGKAGVWIERATWDEGKGRLELG